MRMFTQCPHCQTIFRVNSAHLEVAQGRVRCSRCRHVFNANHHLMQRLPPNKPKQDPFPNINFAEDEVLELLKENTYTARNKSWSAFFGWMFITLLLITVLAGQYLWFTQPALVLQNPQVRPWLQRFCYIFLCTLPTTRDPKQFQFKKMPSLQVQDDSPEVIQIDAIFVNQAPFSQPYPVLELIFKDINGSAIAQRRFTPDTYLPVKYEQGEMKPQDSVHVRLEVVNTENIKDNASINYEFNFF